MHMRNLPAAANLTGDRRLRGAGAIPLISKLLEFPAELSLPEALIKRPHDSGLPQSSLWMAYECTGWGVT